LFSSMFYSDQEVFSIKLNDLRKTTFEPHLQVQETLNSTLCVCANIDDYY